MYNTNSQFYPQSSAFKLEHCRQRVILGKNSIISPQNNPTLSPPEQPANLPSPALGRGVTGGSPKNPCKQMSGEQVNAA
ncbi:MAG: hypothetical protein ABSA45_02145 [Verrucomicrobiota bacterium]|jgi:hypothetical protein